MPMRFQRSWDFNPGNKRIALNDLTQDTEVIAALQEALSIAVTGVANQIPYSNLVSQLQALNVQAAIDEVLAKHEDLEESVSGVIGGAGLNAEGVMDLLGHGALVGDGVTLAYDDVAGTITMTVEIPESGLDTEAVMDHLGTVGLVEGNNITLTYDDVAGTITVDAADPPAVSPGLFRGEWESDSLLGVVDLSGAALPAGLTGTNGGNAQLPVKTTVAIANKGAAPPGLGDAWRMTINREQVSDFSRIAVDLAVLGYENVTRLAAWTAGTSQPMSAELERKNGATFQQVGLGHNWSKVSIPADSNDVIDFAAIGTETNTNLGHFGDAHLWVARIEVYGSAAPYMLGEYVTHLGKLWKSDANNNAGVPGTSGWTEVPLRQPVLLEVGQTAANVPAGTPVGTLIFTKGV
jgi:hypothetical protein